MSMSDPVADFITRIRNATMRKHADVQCPASRLKNDIAQVLHQEGFIRGVVGFQSERGFPQINVELKYDDQGGSVIRGIKRISRPGLRKYCGYQEMTTVLNGQGISIVSTSHGVLTDRECRDRKIGGEVLCQVW
ncbi:MAG: 30S ribosomal protein S8 [SAR324 cluster bacterium]|nr:30S ribosomal protein S8 [SAR324 cluster bacterium]